MPFLQNLQRFIGNVKEQFEAIPEVLKLAMKEKKRKETPMVFRVGEGLAEPQKKRAEETLERLVQTVPPKAPGPIEEIARSTIEPVIGPLAQLLGKKGTIQTPVGEVETPYLKIRSKIEEGKSPLRAQMETIGETAIGILGITPTGKAIKTVKETAEILRAGKAIEKAKPFLNLEKFDPEVREILTQTADDFAEMIQKQRRGVVSWEETITKNAPKLGMTPEKLAKTKIGKAFNAEQLNAAAGLVEQSGKKILGIKKLIQQGQNTSENLLSFQKEMAKHAGLQAAFSGTRAEAGRALNILKATEKALRSKDQSLIDKTLEVLGGREITEEIAQKLSQIDPNDVNAVNKFIRGLIQVKPQDYLTELWYNSVLSGPPTHIINSISNSVFQILQIPVRVVRAGAEVPLAKLTGRQREYYFSEVFPALLGTTKGIGEGIRKSLYVLKNGYSLEDANKLAIEFGRAGRQEAFSRFGAIPSAAVNLPSRAMIAADTFFKSISYSSDLYSRAARIASKEGLQGKEFGKRVGELIANPTKEMIEGAETFSRYVTFTSKPGSIIKQVIRLRNSTGLFGRFIVPFVNTPANLLKTGLEFSPAGMARFVTAKGPEKADVIAKSLIGSMIEIPLAIYAFDGKITGAPPRDPAKRDKFYREGKQPYSIKVGNTWVSYQRMEPFNPTFSAIAALHDSLVNEKREPSAEVIEKLAFTIGNNIMSQTWMEGLSTVINAIEEPERYGERLLSNITTGFVPYSSLFRTITRMTDPIIRKPTSILESVKANIPGLSKETMARRNVWGEKVKREGGPLRQAFPIKTTTEKIDPTEQELERLGVTVGFIEKKIQGITLNEKEYEVMMKATGRLMKKNLDRILVSQEYQRLSDDKKEKIVRNVATEARQAAKDLLFPAIMKSKYNLPDLVDGQKLKDLLSALSKLPKFEQATEEQQKKVLLYYLER